MDELIFFMTLIDNRMLLPSWNSRPRRRCTKADSIIWKMSWCQLNDASFLRHRPRGKNKLGRLSVASYIHGSPVFATKDSSSPCKALLANIRILSFFYPSLSPIPIQSKNYFAKWDFLLRRVNYQNSIALKVLFRYSG